MKIEVRLFATLRQYAPGGRDPSVFELAEGSRVAQVLEGLSIPKDAAKVILVNGRQSDEGHLLHGGDRIVIFPPVAGG
jgi:molybdopterin synthase sulfur carrier subunit